MKVNGRDTLNLIPNLGTASLMASWETTYGSRGPEPRSRSRLGMPDIENPAPWGSGTAGGLRDSIPLSLHLPSTIAKYTTEELKLSLPFWASSNHCCLLGLVACFGKHHCLEVKQQRAWDFVLAWSGLNPTVSHDKLCDLGQVIEPYSVLSSCKMVMAEAAFRAVMKVMWHDAWEALVSVFGEEKKKAVLVMISKWGLEGTGKEEK